MSAVDDLIRRVRQLEREQERRVTREGVQTATSGGAFPSSPVPNRPHWHTGRRAWYVYDGARWLSATEYPIHFAGYRYLMPVNTADLIADMVLDGRYLTYFERFDIRTNVATTNDASNYWTVRFQTTAPGTTIRTLFDITTAANLPNTSVMHAYTTPIVGQSNEKMLALWALKTGNPGVISVSVGGTYRLIG